MAGRKRPLFQHRHYVAIAHILADLPRRLPEADRLAIVQHVADELTGTNPNYDRDRFVWAACGQPSNGRDR